MAYPSPYRAGMSSLGFQTLYRILNSEHAGAHRAFLPDAWEPAALPWPAPPQAILSYEAERPINEYPVIAVSVSYELEVAGLIRLLGGAKIPVLAKDRQSHDPIVVAGGPLTFSNPSCLLPFVDLLISGEAEDELPSALEILTGGGSREQRLQTAAQGEHRTLGEVAPGMTLTLPTPARASRAQLPAYSAIVTPDTELADMFLVEPERGCSRQCTFCVMRGSTNGGMRIFPADDPLQRIPQYARRVGLVGAAVTDHPQLEDLVARIVEQGRGIGISSLRADRLTPTLLQNLHRGGYRQITVASDGISERMRQSLVRKITEQDLINAAKLTAAQRFRGIKIYQMIGVPGETEADVDDLIRLSLELAAIIPLTLTFSTFVAKRNTPLDGQPFFGRKAADDRLRQIQRGLRGKVRIRPQSPRWAHIEYVLAQRGPEVGHAALAAVRAGGRYRDWVGAFDQLPPCSRPLCYGDEERWARRKGKAAERRPVRGLPVVA